MNSRDTWDQNSACEVLVIRRRGYFDANVFLRNNRSLTELAASMVDDGGAATFCGWGADNDVISCTWSKDLLSPAGVFSFQLKRRVIDYLRLITPGDLVLIFMDGAKDYSTGQRFTGRLITVGIVDRIIKTNQATGEGADVSMYSVTGRDFGAIFTDTSTVFDPSFAQIEQALFTGAYQTGLYDKGSVAQSPAEQLLTIIDLFYNKKATGSLLVGAQWQFANKLTESVSLTSLIDFDTFVQRPMVGYSIVDALSPSQAGNVWTLLETYANRVINEMFIDIRDYTHTAVDSMQRQALVAESYVQSEDVVAQRSTIDRIVSGGVSRETPLPKPTYSKTNPPQVLSFVFRQMPYDLETFMSLPHTDVYPTEVFDTEIGYSSSDVANYYKIRTPVVAPEYQEGTYGIRVNINSVYKFGIRRLEPETIYFFASSLASSSFEKGQASQEDFGDMYDYYIGLLATWYAANESMLSGQMTLRFRPDIRIGTRLRLHTKTGPKIDRDSNTHDFYVQSVNHSFSVDPGASRTTVSIVRGIQPGSSDLAANLRWGTNGPQLPGGLSSVAPRFTPFGMEIAVDGEQVRSDNALIGQELPDE